MTLFPCSSGEVTHETHRIYSGTLLGVSALSANQAIANQWEAELSTMGLMPGALAPAFVSPCAATIDEPSTTQATVRSNEDLADWLIATFAVMSVRELEVATGTYEYTTGYSISSLVKMERSELLTALNGADPLVLGELWLGQGEPSEPCATSPAPSGGCTYGVRCAAGATCTDSDGETGSCTTKIHRVRNPLLIGCPNFIQTNYSCVNGCAPTPLWSLLAGAMSVLAVFFRRRLSFLS